MEKNNLKGIKMYTWQTDFFKCTLKLTDYLDKSGAELRQIRRQILSELSFLKEERTHYGSFFKYGNINEPGFQIRKIDEAIKFSDLHDSLSRMNLLVKGGLSLDQNRKDHIFSESKFFCSKLDALAFVYKKEFGDKNFWYECEDIKSVLEEYIENIEKYRHDKPPLEVNSAHDKIEKLHDKMEDDVQKLKKHGLESTYFQSSSW